MTYNPHVTVEADGKKRAIMFQTTPAGGLAPIGPSQVGAPTTNAEGKKKMTVVPLTTTIASKEKKKKKSTSTEKKKKKKSVNKKSPAMSYVMSQVMNKKKKKSPNCPAGCMSMAEHKRRVSLVKKRCAQGDAGPSQNVPGVGVGMDKYQKKLDKMEKTYSKFGPQDEEEDVAFYVDGKSTKKKKSSKEKTGCPKYHGKPLKCLAHGCDYSEKSRLCRKSPATAKKKSPPPPPVKKTLPSKTATQLYPKYEFVQKNKRIADDDDDDDDDPGVTQAVPIDTFRPDLPFAVAAPIGIPPASAPKKRVSPTAAYKKARMSALEEGRLQFTVDGVQYRRKSPDVKVFQKK